MGQNKLKLPRSLGIGDGGNGGKVFAAGQHERLLVDLLPVLQQRKRGVQRRLDLIGDLYAKAQHVPEADLRRHHHVVNSQVAQRKFAAQHNRVHRHLRVGHLIRHILEVSPAGLASVAEQHQPRDAIPRQLAQGILQAIADVGVVVTGLGSILEQLGPRRHRIDVAGAVGQLLQ